MADHFYGTSVSMVDFVLRPLGYTIIAVDYNNAVAVASEYLSAFSVPPPDTGLRLYMEGYWQRPERAGLFPWNANVDHWVPAALEDPYNALRLVSDFLIDTQTYKKTKATFALFVHPEYVDRGLHTEVTSNE
jgi:hypothetical protein